MVMQRRTERHDHRIMVVVRARRAPPSAHLDVSGRAPAVNPQGVDCRRHAAAGAKPCVRMGAPQSPAAGRALLTSPSPNDMQSPNTLQERILAVLERNDGKCLDTEAERQQIADDLVDMLDWFYGDRGI